MSNTLTSPSTSVLDGIGEAAFQLAWYGLGPHATGQRPAQNRVRVFPLRGGSKVPLLKGGCHDASSDPNMVFNMWLKYPFANIGVATGNGLVVIDIDPRNGGTVDPRLPPTRTVATPSGGLHLYYTTDQDIPNSAGRLAQGVDVRGRGGHVVAPPSWTLIDGARCNWKLTSDRPTEVMPAWLVAECRAERLGPNGKPDPDTRARRFNPSDRISEGGRNDYLARYVGWALAQGVPLSEIQDETHAENDYTCAPPLPRDEVERVVSNITRLHRARISEPRP